MKYVRCPKCGTENVANRILCVKCAEELEGTPTYDRFDIGELFSGLKPSLAAAAATPGILTSEIVEKARLWDEHSKHVQTNRIKTGANCFFLIAGISVIETIIFWSGKHINFFDSLGITQSIDFFTRGLMLHMPKLAIIPQITAFLIDILFALGVVALGYLARQGKLMAFVIGMALYSLDTLIVIRSIDILSTAFHLAALYGLFLGLKALMDTQKMRNV